MRYVKRSPTRQARKMRADNYHDKITCAATLNAAETIVHRQFLLFAGDRPIFRTSHSETEATSRRGCGPVTEFLAG